jgi:hypothetical protein
VAQDDIVQGHHRGQPGSIFIVQVYTSRPVLFTSCSRQADCEAAVMLKLKKDECSCNISLCEGIVVASPQLHTVLPSKADASPPKQLKPQAKSGIQNLSQHTLPGEMTVTGQLP